MIVLKSNEYWGRVSGVVSPKDGLIFKLKKWKNGINNSKTPGKVNEKHYKNAKLSRLGRKG